ncbi:hypothetical protein CLV42_101611 [Chitinophaga ginsengisoli]|uniref:Uncharacterized protein n=1 Tax=Chitinophaga ginsengisoli TaxID=363837 RepID=A0A2P8GPF7_9BACT|nr:hypothetical protein CLV42_101611 [Chitinophaga ginsengisoli]
MPLHKLFMQGKKISQIQYAMQDFIDVELDNILRGIYIRGTYKG